MAAVDGRGAPGGSPGPVAPALKIALAGNPNAGKTTLFNALTGSHHKVGNYPGVTVEKREGRCSSGGVDFQVFDLPGIYSLTAYSMDEVVARDFILDEGPDLVVDVMDSTNLERHLYLCMQFQELGIPVVAALNMMDEAAAVGISIDSLSLGRLLGIPFVKTVGTKGLGTDELLAVVASQARGECGGTGRQVDYGAELEAWLGRVEALIALDPGFGARYPTRWLAVKLLEKDANAALRLGGHSRRPEILDLVAQAIAWIEKHFGRDAEVVVSEQRYAYIHGAVAETVRISAARGRPVTEAVDRILMDRFLGLPLFLAILWAVFQATFTIGGIPQAWLEGLFQALAALAARVIPEGLFRLLVVNGIIGGVGAVFSFVPLVVILFLCLAVLEDLGYMSRAAFLTDRFLHAFGLHGQSFLPMMLGFGCSVPAIMGARTLKSRRDRIATIVAIPFMSCGAKLPVYVLMAGAFFPRRPGNAVMLVYLVGIALALLTALLFKRTVLRGDPTPFVMELPPYRVPTLRGLMWHVWEKTSQYMRKMGTIILAMATLVWAMTTFPLLPGDASGRAPSPEKALANSAAGRIGIFLEPALRPMGMNWKLAVATITGFAAKEVVVSTLGILYHGAPDAATGPAGRGSLRSALAASPEFSPFLAFVLMLATLVFPPCVAALATIKAEIGWRWLGFVILYQLALGWLICTGIYQFAGAHGPAILGGGQ